MTYHPIFLSIVLVVKNQSSALQTLATQATNLIKPIVSDYELIIVDNSSTDESIDTLKKLCGPAGIPNLQIYALTKEVSLDTAFWVGLENALGDFVAVIDIDSDDIKFLPEMLDQAVNGTDIVFASNVQKYSQSLPYRTGYVIFNFLYKKFHGVNLAEESPQYRVMNKRVINFILKHPQPSLSYRHLPAVGGFSKVNLTYSAPPSMLRSKNLGDSFDKGMRLIFSTTSAPMRLVTYISLFGAISNIAYSVYIISVYILNNNIAPGWTTLSLQLSGMFLLISLVLFILGEYIIQMASLSNQGPPYHIAQEFNSTIMTRQEKLNIEIFQVTSHFHNID